MSSSDLWMIVLGCGLATFMWRFIGVLFVRRIDPEGAVFEWVSCVSYAMVAGLIFRMLIFPDNELAVVSLGFRGIAIATGFGVYYLFKQSLLPGLLAGSLTLMLLVY
ncbi:MAG: branched-subunit amino acid transport protein [Parasphingorhabdus sp.]|jgi:branched-subunit amino acid transport protein